MCYIVIFTGPMLGLNVLFVSRFILVKSSFFYQLSPFGTLRSLQLYLSFFNISSMILKQDIFVL